MPGMIVVAMAFAEGRPTVEASALLAVAKADVELRVSPGNSRPRPTVPASSRADSGVTRNS